MKGVKQLAFLQKSNCNISNIQIMETSSSKILVLVKDGENNQRCTSQEAWHGKKLTNASNIAQRTTRLPWSTTAPAIGHFRVPKNQTFKARLSAKPLIWKWFLIMMQMKLIFPTKVSHLASFWKWDFLELGNGLFHWLPSPLFETQIWSNSLR